MRLPVRIIGILLTQLFFFLRSPAQENNFSVSFGPAFRSGYHKLNAYGNHLDGYAKLGIGAEVNYRLPTKHPHLNIILSLKARRNQVVPEFIPLIGVKGYSATTGNTSLFTAAMMAGLSYQYLFSSRWSLEEQLIVGISAQRLGETYARGTQPFAGGSDFLVATSKATGDVGFSSAAKIGPVYRLNKMIDIYVLGDIWISISQMKTRVDYSMQQEDYHIGGPGTLEPPVITKFAATHVERNPWVPELMAGIRFKI